jgi:hypothetical protein
VRSCILFTGLFLLPVMANAQPNEPNLTYQAEEANQKYGTKRVMFYDSKRASDTANVNLAQAVQDFQQNASSLKDEREIWLARNQIYDVVISVRSKDSIQTYLDEQRGKLGVGELDGYRRIGIYNPYDGTSYIRYYDDKTGEAKISEVRGFREELEQQRTDIEKKRARLVESEKDVDAKYSTAIDAYNAADTANKGMKEAASALASARERLERQRAAATTTTTTGTGQPGSVVGSWVNESGELQYTFQANGTLILGDGTGNNSRWVWKEENGKIYTSANPAAGWIDSYMVVDGNVLKDIDGFSGRVVGTSRRR